MQIVMTKEALISKLKDRLTAAAAEDARIEKLHKVDEQAALKKFRERLREALKWDYDRVKKIGGYGSGSVGDLRIASPACPKRQAPAISAVLHMVTMSTSKQFTIKTDSDVHRAVTWLPEAERVGVTVCD